MGVTDSDHAVETRSTRPRTHPIYASRPGTVTDWHSVVRALFRHIWEIPL